MTQVNNQPTGSAQSIVAALWEEGVQDVFGIPGTHNLELYRALGDSGIRHWAPRHEQGAGYAADGYARSTGRPGVVITTSGPGLTNACSAVGTAYADSIPILVIAPGMPTGTVGKDLGQLHELKDQFGHMAAIADRSLRAVSGRQAADFVHSVFATWREGRQRPAYLEIPLDVLDGEYQAGSQQAEASRAPQPPRDQTERPTPSAAKVAQVARLLESAQRPVVVLGGGARTVATSATQLVEAVGAIAVTTASGKGVIPETHPLTLGATIDLPDAQQEIVAADVLLVLGSELGDSELGADDWQPGGTVVRVDIDERQLTKRFAPAIAVHADALDFLSLLLEVTVPASQERVATAQLRAGAVRERLAQATHRLGAAWVQINESLCAALPSDTIVAGDSSQVSYKGTLYHWRMGAPRQFLYPAGYSTLGYGLPAAIGAKIGQPHRPVIVLQGDGGFMFTVQELATAVDQLLGIPIVIMNNGGYGEIREQMLARGIPPLGTDLHIPDLAQLCQACGGFGEHAGPGDNVAELVLEALTKDRPTVIEVAVS
ncbi:MAG TPA: thiamine pyrophosphate-binding protein [Mycobacteriales bacterium]|nr:thiamine pyrophosphate-binding protein [Mycobacteriales bacterium]